MTLTTDGAPDPGHLANVGRLQSLAAGELPALPQSDWRWLTPAQLSALHRARYEQWLADHPDCFPRHDEYAWFQWTTEAEGEEIVGGAMPLARRKQIAKEIHEAMGSPDLPTALDIAYQMKPIYWRWWAEIGCPAAQLYGDHAAERRQHRVLEQRYEDHVARQPDDQQARLRERREALAAHGIDVLGVQVLWDDTQVVEAREPVDLAKSHALSDAEWAQLAPFFGEEKQARRNSVSWRQALDAALLVANTRTAWRSVERASALRARLQEAYASSVFSRIRKALDAGELDVCVDRLRRVIEMMSQWQQKARG